MLSCVSSSRSPHQIVMLGLEKAGKTTLLYKLRLPKWNTLPTDLSLQHKKNPHWDVGYHYEEFTGGRLKHYGIWDVPGSDEMIPMWPMFYRYVVVTAVLYVVDASEEATEHLNTVQKARRWLNFLLNEDELRSSAFIVIINERYKKGEDVDGEPSATKGRDPTKPSTRTGKSMGLKMEVDKIQEQAWNRKRFRVFYLDCSDPGREWKEVIEEIHRIKVMCAESPYMPKSMTADKRSSNCLSS